MVKGLRKLAPVDLLFSGKVLELGFEPEQSGSRPGYLTTMLKAKTPFCPLLDGDPGQAPSPHEPVSSYNTAVTIVGTPLGGCKD